MTGRVTIHDVAQVAGVSTTTVSNALTGSGRVSASTREKVIATARALGYTANPTARSLRRRRTGAVGLYLPGQTFGLEYYMNLSIGAATEALDHGLALTLLPMTTDPAATPIHVDGVIVSDPALGDPFVDHLRGLDLPVVTCERDLTPHAAHAGRVESDHDGATRALLDHLAERGAERIALLCPGPETSFGHDIRRSFESWCADAGRDAVVHEVPFALHPEDIQRAVTEALSARRPPDAIVSVPDGGASSALQEVLGQGRRVPDDLLVASYVDSSALRALAIPITAVDIAPREMGRRAVRLLAQLLAGEREAGSVETLATTLRVRASTTTEDGTTS
jgi:DNA-binding LacI/PurR family transcriptional regulator